MKVRPISQKKYQISKHHFLELYHFCLQYPEWKAQLERLGTDTVKAIEYDGLPHGAEPSNPTADLACKRADLSRKCDLVEQTAMEADPDIYQYILMAVTTEGVTYQYLKMMKDIPCGQKMYYNRRKRFYWLLSKKRKEGHSGDSFSLYDGSVEK